MRIFWSLIAILVLATAGLLIVRRLDSAPAPSPAPAPAPPVPAPIQTAQVRPAPTPTPTAPPITPRQPDPATTPTPAPQLEPTPAQPDSVQPETPATTPAQPETPAQPTTPATEAPAQENPAESTPAESPDATKPADTDAPTPPAAADSAVVTPPAAITTPGASSNPRARPTASPEVLAAAESAKAAPTLTKQSDGTTLVAERFIIKGDGSKENPYEVTWEHLMSAQETYKPRLGLKIIPGWLNLIHDKWVRVSGYVAFPVMAQGPDEMLMMLNQWDGCCIGVPPTPYDAIEVKLAKPAEGETRLLIMGSVTGKLKVDPYLVKDWLVSLYIMDEAEVSKQTGAPMRESVVQQEHLAP